MFTIDPSITDLKAKDRNLFKVLFSMNNHQVANPEMSLEEAQSYVFFFREGAKYQAYVGLYFISSDRRMFYSHSSGSFAESEMSSVEEEARAFAEDLGAMLDEIHFSGLSTEDKNNWIDAQDILNHKKQAEAELPTPQPAAPAEPTAAVVPPAPVESPVVSAPVPPAPAEHVPPAVQPSAVQQQPVAAAPQPEPVTPSAPVAPPMPEPAPAAAVQAQPQPYVPPTQEIVVPVDVQEVEKQHVQPRTNKRPAPAAPAARVPDQFEEDRTPMPGGVDDVLEEAVRAGVVKAPTAKLKKDIRTASGAIGREKEALARLLSSF